MLYAQSFKILKKPLFFLGFFDVLRDWRCCTNLQKNNQKSRFFTGFWSELGRIFDDFGVPGVIFGGILCLWGNLGEKFGD